MVRLTSVTDGTGAVRMFGKTGAPAWVGDRLMLIWRSLLEVGRVSRRQQRVRERAKRHAVEEQPGAAAHHGAPRFERRPGESQARRHVVRVGVDRFEELQVVAQAHVERQIRAGFPLVLRVNPTFGLVCDTTVSPKVCVKPELL